jgi:hypothetical protein
LPLRHTDNLLRKGDRGVELSEARAEPDALAAKYEGWLIEFLLNAIPAAPIIRR